MVFTSNREENTVGVFKHGKDQDLQKVKVGGRPNELAFDYTRNMLPAANVPKPDSRDRVTVSIVDAASGTMTADAAVSGRTRWAIFDPKAERFYVTLLNLARLSYLVPKTLTVYWDHTRFQRRGHMGWTSIAEGDVCSVLAMKVAFTRSTLNRKKCQNHQNLQDLLMPYSTIRS
jgi:DNA-binding beta-propeller fold protein YncE